MNRLVYLLILTLFASNAVIGQSLTNDLSFNVADSIPYKSGANSAATVSCIQPDDKIIIAGSVSLYNGVSINGLARLNVNGDLDPTFNAGTGFYNTGNVMTIALQSDGKILLGGSFNSYNGATVNRIIRLNSNGTLDNSFNIGSGPNAYISKIAVQADGKIVLIGDFSQFNSNPAHHNLLRLNPDGSVDNSFSIGSGFPVSDFLRDVAIQSDGKIILVSGFPSTFNGTSVDGVFRLNPDGSLDPSFDIGSSANDLINTVCIQQDGKIIVSGATAPWNGGTNVGIVRLNSDGSVDNSFNVAYGIVARQIVQKSTGEIAIIGDFSEFNNFNRNGNIFLHPDGSLNMNYNGCYEFFNYPESIGFQSNGKLIMTGAFGNFEFFSGGGPFQTGSVIRLSEDGFVDANFNTATGFDKNVRSVKVQSDNKILVGGEFYRYNQKKCNQITRLYPDGTMDSVFNANIGTGATYPFCNTINFYGTPGINDMILYPDGRILLIGGFTEFNGNYAKGLFRINADGTTDNSEYFLSDLTEWQFIKGVLQPDGKILVMDITGELSRLNSDGSVDNTFSSGLNAVKEFALQPDGKIILAHAYPIAVKRLNSNGSVDNTFITGTIPANSFDVFESIVKSVLIQSDNKIIVSGAFDTYNGVPCPSIVRLNPDGSLDANQFIFSGLNADYDASFIQSDGKSVFLGYLMNIPNSWGGSYIMRFNTDGTLYDSTNFHYDIMESAAFAEQNDGKLLIGGDFTSMSSIVRNHLLRLVDCQPIYATQNVTEQFTYTWPVNGVTYTTSGQFVDTMPNLEGCDSIVTLNLTITEMSVTCFTSPSHVDSCNGVVNLSASGTPDFTFDIGNGPTVTSSGYAVFDSLCPGIYSVLVTDGNGDTLNTTFVVPSDSTYLIVDPFGGAPADSAVILIENCDIDYDSIDSVYIESYTILTGDSVLINWAVVDMNGTTIIPSILVLTPGNIYTQLQLYCLNKSIDEYFVATIGINYDGNRISTLGLSKEEVDLVRIYPNPTNDQVRISFSGSEAELTVYDLQGKVVLKDRIQNESIISLQSFERGVYLFDFNNSQGHTVQRVVKQ